MSHPQRQRHGVTKNLVEGIGGAVIGVALVVLLRGLFKGWRDAARADAPDRATTPAPSPTSLTEETRL